MVGRDERSLGEQVFHRIAEAIVAHDLPPGMRVRDVALGQRFHVSRSPVREALHRLERIGLVEILPSRVTQVTMVTDQMVAQTLAYAGYQAGLAVRQSLPVLTPSECAQTLILIDELSQEADDPAGASAARRVLFSYLSERSGNAVHHAHMRDMEYAFERNLRGAALPPASVSRPCVAGLREAVRRGDGDEGERWVRVLHGLAPLPADREDPGISGGARKVPPARP
ncbi:GntR family transcriptional regulator [Microbacterium sp. 2MCAF23]|uniref:GntR family transcriptional regulator n=1 Tax=Microbacterium sp. 2MCAF23 TaxID=3232985 RepID=UPI003F99D91D